MRLSQQVKIKNKNWQFAVFFVTTCEIHFLRTTCEFELPPNQTRVRQHMMQLYTIIAYEGMLRKDPTIVAIKPKRASNKVPDASDLSKGLFYIHMQNLSKATHSLQHSISLRLQSLAMEPSCIPRPQVGTRAIP